MTLEELINLEDTIDLEINYDEILRKYVQNNEDYIKIGNIIRGNKAIVYVRGDMIDRVSKDFGLNNAYYLPIVLGLMGISDLEDSRDISSSTRKYI